MSTEKLSIVDVGRALRAYGKEMGTEAATELLQKIAGVSRVREIPSDPTIRQAIIDAVNDPYHEWLPDKGSDLDKTLHSYLDTYARFRILWREPGYWAGVSLFGDGKGAIWIRVTGPKLGNMFVGRYSRGEHCKYTRQIPDDPHWQKPESRLVFGKLIIRMKMTG